MAALIRKPISAALSPYVTGSLLYLLTRAPDRIRIGVLAVLSSKLPESLPPVRLVKILRVLFVFGLTRRVVSKLNARLSEWAQNNWIWTSEKDRWHWNSEVAVITGGCSGIGAEVVRGLISRGVRVAVLDIQGLPSDLERSSRVTLFKCDVTSPESIAGAAKQVREALGDPSILINNAGIGGANAIVDIPHERVTKVFQINIISHFWLAKEFLPAMVSKNKGHIVGMASMSSFVAPPGIVDYATTKAGVLAFHEGLVQEIKHIYKAPGVKSTIVHPSWVRTPLLAGNEEQIERTQGRLMKVEPVGRRIVDQILSCKGGIVIIPERLKSATGIRAFPSWLQEIIRDRVVGTLPSRPPTA